MCSKIILTKIQNYLEKEGISFNELVDEYDDRKQDLEKLTKTKKKDPNSPKKPLSSFMFFCQQERQNIYSTDPLLKKKPAEVSKILGAKWKKLDEDNKKQYTDLAAQDKIRYKDQLNDYIQHNPNAVSPGSLKSKNKTQLKELLEERNIDYPTSATKQQLIDILEN